jgi:predicted Fe-S protein YdhL (DUF1289 family)
MSALPAVATGPVPVASPCVGICQLDARSVCIGCSRTLREIAEWSAASEARRREIVEAARHRMNLDSAR